MYLKDVLNGVKFKSKNDISDIRINGITSDSRTARRGDLFIAVKGCSLNGYSFIDKAISNSAKAIVAGEDFKAPKSVIKIVVDDTRIALPIIADNFYGHPSKSLKVIGVTGTNGKTTITYIIENIIKRLGASCGVIGTVNYRIKDKTMPAKNTTPGPIELQSLLAEMLAKGASYAIMEVSSHSLDQRRVDRVSFDIGIFTNITSEHLDYHKNIGSYFKAKAILFKHLKEGGSAILNIDDKRVASLKGSIKNRRILTYGIKEDADIKAKDINIALEGTRFIAVTPAGSIEIRTRLIGMHNVSNILASVAATFAMNIPSDAIKKGVEGVSFVPGRLETVEAGQDFKVFVDYAHTEDALFNVLSLLREIAPRRIITVFGCGGDRDRLKRPLMAKVACKFSDHVFITSDNPRFEEPSKIINEIEGGVRGKFSNYEIAQDRREAIKKALGTAAKGDFVMIAGKGHEDYQIIKDKRLPFDDRKIAKTILEKDILCVGAK